MSAAPVLRDVLLEGAHARLRPLDPRDVDAAFAMLHGERRILDWLEWSGPAERDDLLPVYENWRGGAHGGSDVYLAIEDLADGAFAGCISARFRGPPGVGDLGFWVDVERHGRGLGGDAVALTAWLCFEHLAAALLSARVFVGNDASRRVLEKAGFREDHRSRSTVDGEPREQWHFGLTRASLAASAAPRTARVVLEPDA